MANGVIMTDVYAPYRAKHAELCAKRDAVNAEVAKVQVKLNEALAKEAEAKSEVDMLAAEIQVLRGGQSWLDLKKEIGALAKLLSGK